MKQEKETIRLVWREINERQTVRVGAMYCFHSCDLNRN